ncbi:hypothetical protein AAG906_011088 [Vitis piasezkii]
MLSLLLFILIVIFSFSLCVDMDDILALCLIACCMSALLLCVCMLLVCVGRISILLPLILWFQSFLSFQFLHLHCMCGGDDHLAWKRPVSSEMCRGLRTTGRPSLRSFDQDFLSYTVDLPSWVRVERRLVRFFTTAMASIHEALAMANLLAKFRMLEIERYMGIGCPRIHLRLYKVTLITLFPLSLSGVAQRWFASLESSRRGHGTT